MRVRWICLLVVLLAVSLPVTAQEDASSPWSLEIREVRTEASLTTTLGLDRMVYTPEDAYAFLVVEVGIDYANETDSAVSVEIASNAFAIRDMAGFVHVADGTAGPMGGCLNCQTTFPLEVAAGAQVSSIVSVVFVVLQARVNDPYLLQFQDAEPLPFTLGEPLVTAEAQPVDAVTPTRSQRGAPSPTPEPPTADPDSNAEMALALQTEMALLVAEVTGTYAARATPTPTPDLRATAASLLTATASAWTPAPLPPAVISVPFCDEALASGELSGNTYLCVAGDPNDWVSGGENWLLQPPEVDLFISPSDNPTTATECLFNDGGVCIGADRWALSFQPAASEAFGVGLYERAQRIPFNSQGHPGIEITNGGGCNQIDGTFEVRELETDVDGSVIRFAANFEQRCEGHDYGLRGYVRFNASSGQ